MKPQAMNWERSLPIPQNAGSGAGRIGHALVLGWLVLVAASAAHAAIISEDFSSDPRAREWKSFGDTNLFRWNATNQNLEVTWDSSRTNSFFHFPLGTILSS